MRAVTVGVALAAVLLPLALSGPAAAADESPDPAPADGVVVVYSTEATEAQRDAATGALGVDAVSTLGSMRFELVETPAGVTAEQLAGELLAQPGVIAAVPDILFSTQAVPDDPDFVELWGLDNTGQSVDGQPGGTVGADIDVVSAWDRTVGSPSVVVAVLDTGYFFGHPDLAPVAWVNAGEVAGNGIDDEGNGYTDDVHGWDALDSDGDPTDPGRATAYPGGPVWPVPDSHGVHTAGTIGAQGGNGVDVTGVVQDARLMPVRVCDSLNNCPLSAIVAGINYAGANGADIANLSITGHLTADEAVAALPMALALGANPQTLFVIAAGNNAIDADTPDPTDVVPYPCAIDPSRPDAVLGYTPPAGAIDNVLCVAATDQNDARAAFSNVGAESVDLGAPGVAILSTAYRASVVYEPQVATGGYSTWTTPSPPAADPTQGFVSWTQPSNEYWASDRWPSEGPPTHVPGTTRATQSPSVSVGEQFRSCDVAYVLSSAPSPDDVFAWSILRDGEVVFDAVVPLGSTSIQRGPLIVLPDDGDPHDLAVQLRYTRGTTAVASAFKAVGIRDLTIECREATTRFSSGTSMAAPAVAGAAALLLSVDPGASVAELRAALIAGVDVVPALEGVTVSGGRLDVWRALEALAPLDTRILAANHDGGTTTISFDGAGTVAATFECSIDDGPFTPCASPVTYKDLAQGEHAVEIRSVLPGGVDATPARTTWSTPEPALAVLPATGSSGGGLLAGALALLAAGSLTVLRQRLRAR